MKMLGSLASWRSCNRQINNNNRVIPVMYYFSHNYQHSVWKYGVFLSDPHRNPITKLYRNQWTLNEKILTRIYTWLTPTMWGYVGIRDTPTMWESRPQCGNVWATLWDGKHVKCMTTTWRQSDVTQRRNTANIIDGWMPVIGWSTKNLRKNF